MSAAGDPAPPFVRFERKSAADFMVWIATPENYDRDALNAAMTAPDAHGAPRSVVGFFGYSLTPDEDALLTRYEARDTGADFWAAVEAAGLLGAHGTPHQLGGMPSAVVPAEGSHGTLQFAGMPRAIGLPLDLARGPIFSPRTSEGDEVQLALTTTVLGSLHNKPFTITTKDGLPEVRDGLLLSELIKRYVDQGLPGSRNVDVTTTDLSDAAGYAARGGRQFRLAVDALIRLRSATLENAVRLDDGSLANYVWGMVDAGWMRSGEGGRGQVRLSEELVGMVRRGLLVYYDRETLRGLVDADRYAARLWMFLEAESLSDTPRRYSIFSAPKGAPPAERDTPAIADLLDLREKRRPDDPTGWGRRRDIVRRVRRAAAELQEHDPRYTITVEQAKSHPSMKNLCVSRRRVPAVAPPVDNPGEVCTPGRAPCVLPVAPLCTPGRAPSDETPANHERDEIPPSVLPSVLPSKERAGAAAPRLSQDSFATFWSAYPRQEQSHRDKASRAFAKLSDDDRAAATRGAAHVADSVAAGTLSARYTWQPENFLRDVFRDWQDGPPPAYRQSGNLADVLAAGVLAFDLEVVCHVCGELLTPDERADETLTTHDGTGWRHVGCDYDRAFLTD